MGFFSSASKIAGGLSGLAGGAEQSQDIPASGFFSMPKEYQNLYTGMSQSIYDTLLPNGAPNTEMFTPLAQTADETEAFSRMREGFTPDEEQLRSDVSMFMNPFDDYVLDGYDRDAELGGSMFGSELTGTGQFGSNRGILGANDIEQTRLNNRGMFRQAQYNDAVNKSLGRMTDLRMGDAGNLLEIGEFERGLDRETNLAPYTALSAAGGLLSGLPTQFGTQREAGVAKSGSSAGDTLGKVSQGLQLAGTVAGFFSDERLKENIEAVGEKNGIPIIHFNYIGDDTRYEGVKAQDVEKVYPEAVGEQDGYMTVDYNMIGIPMREIN